MDTKKLTSAIGNSDPLTASLKKGDHGDSLELEITAVPISLNALYRTVGKRMRMTTKGKQFKETWKNIVSAFFYDDLPHYKKGVPITMEVVVYYTDHRRRDVDNTLKVLLDTFNGVLYADDSQIQSVKVDKVLGSDKLLTKIKLWRVKHA